MDPSIVLGAFFVCSVDMYAINDYLLNLNYRGDALMTIMNDLERAELTRLRRQTKAFREEIAQLKMRLEKMQAPITVQELIEAMASVVDEDLPVYVYNLSTEESYPLIGVDQTISDRIDLNFRSENYNEDHA